MVNFDQYRDNITSLVTKYEQTKQNRNEAMTRFEIIDILFFECLGWSKSEGVQLEEHQDGDYSDYVFSDVRDLMIVEAKREGDYFEVPAGYVEVERKLGNVLKDNPNMKIACRQAMVYATERGVPIAVVCNGHQLIAFIATRQDGIKPLEGKALVFGSLAQMDKEFPILWDALSKPAVLEGVLIRRLTRDITHVLPSPLSARIHPYPGTKGRNDYQASLNILSEIVLEDVANKPEEEEEFLRYCYCLSGALSQHSLESKSVLAQRYAKVVDEGNPGPTISAAVNKSGEPLDMLEESIGRRPILLLGDVGVGKTSFIRHLIKIDAKDFFKSAIPIYLDLGSNSTLSHPSQLKGIVVTEIQRQLDELYGINIHERNFFMGVYDKDIKKWQIGIDVDIRESNPALYAERRHAFLTAKISDKVEHLKQAIRHIVKGQRKPIVLFIDNLDQRIDNDFQQQAFLIAHEMSANWEVIVFVTLRPETFHQSRRTGVLSGYHPKAFTIAPPRVDQVIKKRLDYALKITSTEFSVGRQQGSTAKVTALRDILQSLRDTMESSNNIISCVDNLSGGDTRISLDIMRGFFGSGHVNTRKIAETPGYRIPVHEFIRAIIYGDYVHYDPAKSPLIANLFQVSSPDPKDHFLSPIILLGIRNLRTQGSEGGFVPTASVFQMAQGLGFSPAQIQASLQRCHDKKLLQTSARLPVGSSEYIRVTSTGVYHAQELIKVFQYVDAMIVDTPILDTAYRNDIADADLIVARLARARRFADYLGSMWKAAKLPTSPFDWNPIQRSLLAEIDFISTKQSHYV
jgi:hypothetical protein